MLAEFGKPLGRAKQFATGSHLAPSTGREWLEWLARIQLRVVDCPNAMRCVR